MNQPHFHIVTLFPEAFESYLKSSIIGRAVASKKIRVSFYNPRAFSKDKHKKVDRRPYSGGPGMVLEALPVLEASKKAIGKKKKMKKIFLTPEGKKFDAKYAKRLGTQHRDVLIVAGHYEGVDARVQKILRADKVSVGPYVLTGGELAALVIVDAASRFVPGVLGKGGSLEDSRISSSEVYTRPEVFSWKKKKYRVPKVLLSGHHDNIEKWKKGIDKS